MSLKYFGEGFQINEKIASEVCIKNGIDLLMPVSMLPFGDKIGAETRKLYFGKALTFEKNLRLNRHPELNDNPVVTTRIFSFGDCNFACPYCKRDCQFIGENGLPQIAEPIPLIALFRMAEAAFNNNEIVRFSGGDPVMFPAATLAIAEYMQKTKNVKSSIAHNGSGVAWIKKIRSFLGSAAIDLKATPEKLGRIAGISLEAGERFFYKSLETQQLLLEADVILDVRTPVFGDTTTEEMMFLAKNIDRNSFWTWRVYKEVTGCSFLAPKKEEVIAKAIEVSSAFPSLWIGMRAKWEKGGMVYFREGRTLNLEESKSINGDEKTGSGNRSLAAK